MKFKVRELRELIIDTDFIPKHRWPLGCRPDNSDDLAELIGDAGLEALLDAMQHGDGVQYLNDELDVAQDSQGGPTMDEQQRKAEEWAHEAPTSELLQELWRDMARGWDLDPKFRAAEAELDLRIPRRRA